MGWKEKLIRIQTLIAVSTIAITLLVIIFMSLFLYNKFSGIISTNSIDNANTKLEHLELTLESYMEGMIQDCVFIEDILISNDGVIDSDVENQFNTMYTTRKDITTIAVFDMYGNLVKISPSYDLRQSVDISETEWFQNAFSEKELYHFIPPGVSDIYSGNYNWNSAVCTKITVEKNGKSTPFILRLDTDFSKVAGLLSDTNLNQNGYVFLVDGNNDIIYHPQQQILSTGQIEESALKSVKKTGRKR